MSLIGQTAPDFTLPDTNKDAVTLSSFRGRKVVLSFYPAAFTGVCKNQACGFRDAMESLNEVNATVLGISVDSPFANGVFAEQNNLNYTLLSDYNRVAVNAYGIPFENFSGMAGYTSANRVVFVVDESGTIIYEWFAPHLGMEPNYEEVKAALT